MDESTLNARQIKLEIDDLKRIIDSIDDPALQSLRDQLQAETDKRKRLEQDLAEAQNKIENELAESEQRFRSIIKNTEAGYFFIDKDGIVRDVNDAWLRMYRYSSMDEVIGQHFAVLQQSEDLESAHEFVSGIMRGDPQYMSGEFSRKCADGTLGYHNFSARPVTQHGGVIGIEGFIIDITDRKAAEEALLESEKRFRLMMEQSPSVIELYDLDGLQVEVNKAYETLWGFPASHTVNKFNVLKSEEVEKLGLMKYLKMAYDGQTVNIPEYKYDPTGKTEADGLGRTRWLSTRIYPLKDKTGNVKNIVITHEDITDRKLIEYEREQLMRSLELKNKELRGIVYSASHDLKSPLVNIEGFGGELNKSCESLIHLLEEANLESSIRDEIDILVKEHIPESLKFISAGTVKIKVLLDGLLRVSRIGTTDILIEKLDVSGLVGKVIDATRFQIEENNVSIKVKNLPDCLGDAGQVNQIFSNLVDNALKYMHPDRTPAIRISGEVEGDMSVYCIEDNGLGIRKEHQEKVFDVFHRLHPGGEVQGEGLGLTITSRILDRHNGSIWLESELDKGTRFYISLPTA